MKNIGKNLKYTREEKGLSVYEVEKQTSINHQSLYEYEKGNRAPSILQIVSLAN